MIGRLLERAHYLWNVRPGRVEPPGCDSYRRANNARTHDYERQAAALMATLDIPHQTELCGADATDYWLLYRYVMTCKPKRILELGGGITTLVMAKALAKIGSGEIVSVDHLAKYSDATRMLLPPDLAAYVSFVVTPSELLMRNGRTVLRYADVPKGHYDLIYVDGPPTNWGEIDFASVDVLDALDKHPSDIIIDRRLPTVYFTNAWLTGNVWFDPALGVGFARSASAQNIERDRSAFVVTKPKPKPVLLGDAVHELIERERWPLPERP
jgi:hypothetical protein